MGDMAPAPAARRRGARAGRLFKPTDPKTGAPCGVWWIDYSIRGRRFRESSKTTVRAEAAALLRQRLAEHATGRFAPNAERVTLDQLIEGFRRHYTLKGRRSLDRAEIALKHIRDSFGAEARAVDLTAPRLEAYAVERGHKVAAATVGYELACLRKAVTLAVRSGLIATRPVFPALAADNVRQGFFEPEEVTAVLTELPEVLRPVVRFALLTGWRKSEVLNLTWDRVDFGAGIVRLDPGTTKSGAGRLYPFAAHPELAALLERQRDYTGQVRKRTGSIVRLVFHREGRPIKSMDAAWRAACKRAGCHGRLFHDLRRTSARALVRAGVSEVVAMKLTGHKTRSVFDRYCITSGRDLVEAVTKLVAAEADRSPPSAPKHVLPLKAVAAGSGEA